MLTNMPRLPLQTLPAFCAVARLGTLRAAAIELHLTHSAVSQQIRMLEAQIGVELFDRRRQRVVLNAAGTALLRSVEPALAQLDDGLRGALAVGSDAQHQLRVTLLPSFAQRWLLPRMLRWREAHPQIGIELHVSYVAEDLQRDGFHAALRQGAGQWRGLESELLIASPWVVVGSPAAAKRLHGRPAAALAEEPLLGGGERWERWFKQAGVRAHPSPVASFNDAGLMLQASEQDIGIALTRELLAADALRDGRLLRLSTLRLEDGDLIDAYWLVYPPALKETPSLAAFRGWLLDELAQSRHALASETVEDIAPNPPRRR